LAPALSQVLAENPHLTAVTFYRLHCAAHGSFRIAAADPVRACPICGSAPKLLFEFLNCRGATKRILPAVESWRLLSDVAPLTPLEKAKLANLLLSEDQVHVTRCRKKGPPRKNCLSAGCAVGKHSCCHAVECPCKCHAAVQRENAPGSASPPPRPNNHKDAQEQTALQFVHVG
jgi:hypothetical protein